MALFNPWKYPKMVKVVLKQRVHLSKIRIQWRSQHLSLMSR